MHWSCQATLETVALFGLISLTTQTKGWEYCGQALSWIGTAKKGWNMRRNLPVTQREYPLPAGFSLVSTTDTRGRITYCNPAFVEVSGYSRDELLGQPHNLIRHPDMPEEAFRDMWATIACRSALVGTR
jgi:PAS domain-containing protein